MKVSTLDACLANSTYGTLFGSKKKIVLIYNKWNNNIVKEEKNIWETFSLE